MSADAPTRPIPVDDIKKVDAGSPGADETSWVDLGHSEIPNSARIFMTASSREKSFRQHISAQLRERTFSVF